MQNSAIVAPHQVGFYFTIPNVFVKVREGRGKLRVQSTCKPHDT